MPEPAITASQPISIVAVKPQPTWYCGPVNVSSYVGIDKPTDLVISVIPVPINATATPSSIVVT